MKIVFLCGSLEPGRDGIGDYVRCLAAEIIVQGHSAFAVALNDHDVTTKYQGVQTIENIDLNVLRIPSSFSTRKRFVCAKKWIDEITPDWISIQFVPYAFHSKGLAFSFVFYLKKLTAERRAHIMFHETWIGENSLGVKLKFMSMLQRLMIKKMLKNIRPAVMHTSLPINYCHLKKLGYTPKVLPLFSNISVSNKKFESEKNVFRIGFFSQAENFQSVKSFLHSIGAQVTQQKMKLEVLLMGGTKNKMLQFRNAIEQLMHYKNNIICTEFLPPEQLSARLQTCTLGVTPVPRHALGKSGSVAAFLAHGIPVAAPNVCEGYDPSEIGFFTPELKSSIMLKPQYEILPILKASACKAGEIIRVEKVAITFLSDLQNFQH